ncbi:50S ribosomal protein L11 methyltransferase [uncultured Clostridium sp.]|jgi:ribosomal protein L11 methyltransferase|uniref:50S ribosomal protein L11 methyltransferase n=1 Tax=uncultured Clostridium sp. TaxID=59620 RepID=UPI0026348A0C|nr:50S ribosomal protein L11 methyltransferase [uncultured Clostridium sp.]
MQGNWIEIQVITTSEALEPVSGIFYTLDCKGVAIEDPEDVTGREKGPLTWDFADLNIFEHNGECAVVKAYFAETDNIEEIVTFVKEKVEEIKEWGFDIGRGEVSTTEKKEEDWANTWKQYYKPTNIGPNIVIKPTWEVYEKKDNEMVIEMDPGMAFGTGTHETTRLCAMALEKYVKEDSTVFDIGTGSGILALIASKLKAKYALGVDLDPVAVESAKKNIELNDVTNIEIVYGDLVEVVEGKADIVVANILAEIVCLLTDDVKKVLKKDGLFISSGIIHERKQMVLDKLEEQGFEIIEATEEGEWDCIIAKFK